MKPRPVHLTLHFAACCPVPGGVAGWAYVAYIDGANVAQAAGTIPARPSTSAATAGYTALGKGLRYLSDHDTTWRIGTLTLCSDSAIVINQVNNIAPCPPNLKGLLERVRDLLAEIGADWSASWSANWVPGAKNMDAAALAKAAWERASAEVPR